MTAVDDSLRSTSIALPGIFSPVAAPRSDVAVPRTVVTPRSTPTLERRRRWEKMYRTRLAITDVVIVFAVTALTTVGQLQLLAPDLLAADPAILARVPLVSALTWLIVLGLFHTRSADIIGSGSTEYKRVAHATGLAFGILAIAFVLFQWQGIRVQLLFALPVGLVALLAGRWAWRKWLLGQRRFGNYISRALVVGHREDVEYVIDTLQRNHLAGYMVVGATLEDDDNDAAAVTVGGITYDNVGTANTVAKVANVLSADTIIVASKPDNDPDYIKQLSWQLEGTAAEMVLSSRLADVAGPRISLRQVEGLPLIRVAIPTFAGGQHVLKRALDILVAGFAILMLSPLLPVLAILIKTDSRGPVFFRQERIGRDGTIFRMVKFRSMGTDAEARLADLQAENQGSGLLFKMKSDPRVTRVGRVLRKYSLDELPQFWNVLVGDMSVVGPRPPLPKEVSEYDGTVFRRLYIKPGITGLWQVSGRSDLSWDESVGLDLRYVENWSVMNDLMIMWRTAKVMIQPSGAY
ncbi:sugar transferase [Microbacterium sp. P03]|uniref:sugar transferase n=1 Tax=Microbacterium sp. P03 TaxID=3366946 RepID=UPI00374522F2